MANTGTDIGALTEALNDKMDRDIQNRAVGVQTVVETWHDGTEWYRVWSDGWIEQGGIANGDSTAGLLYVPFNKPFVSFVAYVNSSIYWPYTSTNVWFTNQTGQTWSPTTLTDIIGMPTQITLNGFYLQRWSSHNWYACGY